MRKFPTIGLTILVLFATTDRVYSENIVATFSGNGFRTLAKDISGKVYIGGVNELIQLHPNLTVSIITKTGPRNYSLECPPDPRKSCEEQRKPTNSTSKLLVIDTKGGTVIACSTLFFGFCEKYSLKDLKLRSTHYETVVTNSDLSAVGMLSDGFGTDDELLYVGSAPSPLSTRHVPMLATRKVDTLDVAHRVASSASFIDYRLHSRPEFITFKEVFDYGNYIYYLTVQKDWTSVDSDTAEYGTHLVRICKHDQKYHSYIQIPLICHLWPDGYNIAQAAYLGKAGKILADLTKNEKEKLAEEDDVIYIAFSQSFSNSHTLKSGSALCVYSMKNIISIFARNLAECFRGNGHLGPKVVKEREPCKTNVSTKS